MRSRCSSIFTTSVLITASLVALASAARAAVYDISIRNRFFCCTNPPVFIAGQSGSRTFEATASVTGAGTPAIKIGRGHAVHTDSVYSNPDHSRPSIRTVRRTVSVSNGSGTLRKSGGYGSFSFCPKAKGPGPFACAKASHATPASFNGRIKVTPGSNRFGGTLQILAGAKGLGGQRNFAFVFDPVNGSPVWLIHALTVLSPIGAMTPARQREDVLPSSTSFSPLVFYQGGRFWQNGAGPFTTGMVTVQATTHGVPPTRSVMLTGYDHRTPMGLGNIQLVSGILTNRYAPKVPITNLLGWQMRIRVIPEPTPSLGLAAGALALLCVGCRRMRDASRAA